MSRIVYLVFAPQVLSGGSKVTFRHVEALTALGFDAVVRIVGGGAAPRWFDHTARIEDDSAPLAPSDILVLPEDSPEGLRDCAPLPNRKIVFCQNPYLAAAHGLPQLDPQVAGAYREFFACSAWVAGWISRFLAYDRISVVPGFADERLFAPAPKVPLIACIPRKRKIEAAAIRHMFERLYRGDVAWEWRSLNGSASARWPGPWARRPSSSASTAWRAWR